jgi:hypothetical protein
MQAADEIAGLRIAAKTTSNWNLVQIECCQAYHIDSGNNKHYSFTSTEHLTIGGTISYWRNCFWVKLSMLLFSIL